MAEQMVCHWCDAVIEPTYWQPGDVRYYDMNGLQNCLWVDMRNGALNRLLDANGRWLFHEPSEVVWARDSDSSGED